MKSIRPIAEVVVQRAFAAPREQVFDAWTDPKALLAWFRPAPEWLTTSVDVDLRKGGRYRISMRAPDGQVTNISGTYREIDPPKKLAFTWIREGVDEGETLVTVEFRERSGVTEVTLRHASFADKAVRDRHERRWQGSLQNLAVLFTKGGSR